MHLILQLSIFIEIKLLDMISDLLDAIAEEQMKIANLNIL